MEGWGLADVKAVAILFHMNSRYRSTLKPLKKKARSTLKAVQNNSCLGQVSLHSQTYQLSGRKVGPVKTQVTPKVSLCAGAATSVVRLLI